MTGRQDIVLWDFGARRILNLALMSFVGWCRGGGVFGQRETVDVRPDRCGAAIVRARLGHVERN